MATYPVTEPEILNLVKASLVTLNVPNLNIKIFWNTRYTSRLGCAISNLFFSEYRIEFSVKLWERADQEERDETVVHEVCHSVEAYFYKKTGHGRNWKNLMGRCGYPNPKRCHTIDNSDLKRKRKDKSALMKCGCAVGVIVGPVVAKRIREGRSYRCRICGSKIKS